MRCSALGGQPYQRACAPVRNRISPSRNRLTALANMGAIIGGQADDSRLRRARTSATAAGLLCWGHEAPAARLVAARAGGRRAACQRRRNDGRTGARPRRLLAFGGAV